MSEHETTALVTGAGTGIGAAITERLAAKGMRLVLVARDRARLEETARRVRASHGVDVRAVPTDLSRPGAPGDLAGRLGEAGVTVDVLVNNAGIETIIPFLEMTDEQWMDVTMVNLRSGWLCSQVFCRRAVEEKRPGAIINIGSIQAARVLPGRTHYAPSKLAIEALTRNMSAEVGQYGIRVNCVHPGLIDTPMTEWIMKDAEVMPLILAQISLARAGQPREIGTVVALLVSDDASYLTGQSIFVDGGWQGK